jgi:hypothetical protein
MRDAGPNVITIDGRAIEHRLERRGVATALILHGGHMSARCRFGEETFLDAGCSVLPSWIWSNSRQRGTVYPRVRHPPGGPFVGNLTAAIQSFLRL